MTTATDTPRVYVACLASYNNGILHGEWIDATDADEIREEIAFSVAIQLEKVGFTVTGKPKGERGLSAQHFGTVVSSRGVEQTHIRRVMPPDQWRAEYKRNLASQNWKGE